MLLQCVQNTVCVFQVQESSYGARLLGCVDIQAVCAKRAFLSEGRKFGYIAEK